MYKPKCYRCKTPIKCLYNCKRKDVYCYCFKCFESYLTEASYYNALEKIEKMHLFVDWCKPILSKEEENILVAFYI